MGLDFELPLRGSESPGLPCAPIGIAGTDCPLPPCARSSFLRVMAAQTRALVSGQWLAEAVRCNLVGPKLRILDTSWYLPKLKRDTKAEFAQRHIPGSLFFDIDECSDRSSALDHMLPTASHFSRYVGDLGIGSDTHVVVYDTSDFGSFSAPRVWWMFRMFGHSLVSVLDGGWKNWLLDGHPVTAESCVPERTEFRAAVNLSWVKSYEDVLENVGTRRVQVVDARSAGRFRGTEPEPRDDTLPGHFPGAINMPFTSFMDASGKELETEGLSKLFREAGVDLEQPLWTTCGSGVTACHVVLAAHLLGHPGACVYDGSWSEWFKRASPELIISEGEGKKV
ncbi:3-mercaptopyruvate sulfurtransferase-like [Platichthys flesus]|uniref:3-mercaptopyruvate sulfurtransferase-like n=1 Tax=Platichthys flesus TaxID=8260 RepID=UPI002DBD3F54|nr:3-mercaptopyruvate sulfurtransferase-like [Platichthys flesus]